MKKVIQLAPFAGFSPDMLDFLVAVRENDSKTWFAEHKHEYERYILQPMQALVNELAEFMLEIDHELMVTPAVGKTISRLNRDIRFSKDKSLYRDHVWFTFKRRRDDWRDTPVYYFEIAPDFYRYGMGYHQPTKETMDCFRAQINDNVEEFLKVTAFYRDPANTFELEGDKYKRLLPSSHQSAEVQEWYQRKNFYLACNRFVDDLLLSPELIDELKGGFTKLIPLYHYLWRLKE